MTELKFARCAGAAVEQSPAGDVPARPGGGTGALSVLSQRTRRAAGVLRRSPQRDVRCSSNPPTPIREREVTNAEN